MMSKRIVEAIRGAVVADAASMGTHWIYDPSAMATAVDSLASPEFKDPPTPNFYSSKEFPGHYEKAGQLSPYGEQLMFMVEYVATTPEATGETMSKKFLEWAKTFGGRQDSATKAFVKNMEEGKVWPECGADDSEAHIFMKIVPVTSRYAGSNELKERVVDAIKMHQNNDIAIAFGIAAARILEAVLLGCNSLPETLDDVKDRLKDDIDKPEDVIRAFERAKAVAATHTSLSDFLKELSHEIMKDSPDSPYYDLVARSCALPGSFVGPLMLFYRGGDYATALRENILASGDTCSRSVFIGSVLAAAAETVPEEWMSQLDGSTKANLDAFSGKIAELNKQEDCTA